MTDHSIQLVGQGDLPDLLPLMRAYCDFYRVSPTDAALLTLTAVLVDDPEREGLQLIARDSAGRAVGFATVYWTWSTSHACRIGVMNDLFVAESARGQRLPDRLIAACRSECFRRNARRLTWQTTPDNLRARAVYERIGARREEWIDYWLDATQATNSGYLVDAPRDDRSLAARPMQSPLEQGTVD
jgi:RimJ/RimL family protein N-acetyltransferase